MMQAEESVATGTAKRRGLFGRFLRGRENNKGIEESNPRDEREIGTPSPENSLASNSREEIANNGEDITAAKTNIPKEQKSTKSYVPPTARESAFSGPPRYDWIDVETAAAIKVQAAYRRAKVMSNLQQQGKSTAAIRRRARRLEAQKNGTEFPGELFQCCGMALVFGDGDEEDYVAKRAEDKALFEQRRKEREEKEAQLRRAFPRLHKEKQAGERVEEAYEVVEQASF